MSILVPISKAEAKLSELIRHTEDEDVILLMNQSTPAAVLVSPARYNAMQEGHQLVG
jgi:prevent-host-death family protein